jgi:hypothetical protein
MPTHHLTSALDIQGQLQELRTERALASAVGLTANAAYMEDLEAEIQETIDAYVGAAVTEIATLRGELGGRQVG